MRASATCDPMNPAAPVTMTFISYLLGCLTVIPFRDHTLTLMDATVHCSFAILLAWRIPGIVAANRLFKALPELITPSIIVSGSPCAHPCLSAVDWLAVLLHPPVARFTEARSGSPSGKARWGQRSSSSHLVGTATVSSLPGSRAGQAPCRRRSALQRSREPTGSDLRTGC